MQIFCTGKVLYAGQSLGLVVAKTQMQAIQAAKLVQVKYKDLKKPVLTIKEAIKDSERVQNQYFLADQFHDSIDFAIASGNLEGNHQNILFYTSDYKYNEID